MKRLSIVITLAMAVLLACAIPGGSPTQSPAPTRTAMEQVYPAPMITPLPSSTPYIPLTQTLVPPTQTTSWCEKFKTVLGKGSYENVKNFLESDGFENYQTDEKTWIPAPTSTSTMIFWTPTTRVSVDLNIAKIILEEEGKGTVLDILQKVLIPYAGSRQEVPEVCLFE